MVAVRGFFKIKSPSPLQIELSVVKRIAADDEQKSPHTFFASNAAEPLAKQSATTIIPQELNTIISQEPLMKFTTIPLTEEGNKRSEILSIIKSWEQYDDSNTHNDTLLSDYQLYRDWRSIKRDILLRLTDKEDLYVCHLLYVNNELQGIALCEFDNIEPRDYAKKELPPRSYHIYELLSAPWNILPRCVEKFPKKKPMMRGVGTAMLSGIVDFVKNNLNVDSITVVAGYPMSWVGSFYRKRKFDRSNERSGVYRLTNQMYSTFLNLFKPMLPTIIHDLNPEKEKEVVLRKMFE